MSQLSLKVKDGVTYNAFYLKEFICGLDRPLQHWFFQLWCENTDEDTGPSNPESLVGCSRGQLLDAIQHFCDMDDPKVAECFASVALDLDPGADQYNR